MSRHMSRNYTHQNRNHSKITDKVSENNNSLILSKSKSIHTDMGEPSHCISSIDNEREVVVFDFSSLYPGVEVTFLVDDVTNDIRQKRRKKEEVITSDDF